MLEKTIKNNYNLKAVDFFCSGGGMSCGIQQAGIQVLAGIDIDQHCETTYVENIKAKFIHADIFKYATKDLQSDVGINKNDDDLIFIGCSPCQYWSVMRTDKKRSSESKNLLCEFLRFVTYYRPGYLIVENVPGILKKKAESKLDHFINTIESIGYSVQYKVVSLDDYGIPQSRKRFTLVATRCSNAISLPKAKPTKKTVRDVIGDYRKYPRITAGHKDNTLFQHATAGLSETNIRRLKMTPEDGGTRQSWAHTKMQLETYKRNNVCFKDTYGRMYWDKPAPTITTKFFSISNGRFAHPEQHRPISLREGASLQTFPINYNFLGTSIAGIAKIIGNAVPPQYAKQLGQSIINSYTGRICHIIN